MKYALVATANYLLCVDLISKKAVPIEQNRPEYYGISWFPNEDELVLSHSALDNATLVDIASYAQSETGYISQGIQQTSKPFLSQPHQILCAPDGRIICANTGRNVVTVIDLNKPGHYQETGVSSARWDRLSLDLKIGDHINSVFLKNDKLFIICHRFDKGSFLATFAYPSLELISLNTLSGITGLHNILVTQDEQYISCNSEVGGLVELTSGQTLWQSGTEIYTRGLAASSEYLVIGESQKGGRDSRQSSLSSLWIMERDSWNIMDYICLGPYGCVHEVRLLDVPDEAHHGHIFQGLNKLLQKNIYEEIAQKSLNTSQLTNKTFKYWQKYKMIFGSSEILNDGMKKAGKNALCLAIIQEKENHLPNTFAFDYILEPSEAAAHVSAVIGYNHSYDDKNMLAIILQGSPTRANLSLWLNDGTTWRTIEKITTGNLPLEGTMKVNISNDKIDVFIARKKVLSFSPEKINIKDYTSGLGIRWTNAAVRPVIM